MTKDDQDKLDLVKRLVAQLHEHMDSVQVFCTYRKPGEGTGHIQYGAGCWFSRYGLVRHWLLGEDESCRQLRKSEEP